MQYSEAELARRIERVRVLLDTYDDPYDTLSRRERTYRAEFTSRNRRYRCGHCAGAGCARCDRGRVMVVERDPYDTGRDGVFDPSARSRLEQARAIDNQIDHLRELELVRAGVYAQKVEYENELEAAERRDARGSYRELRAALDLLPGNLHGDDALVWLAEHLPARWIRVPYEAEQRLLEDLKPRVAELRAARHSTRWIAAELGLRPSDVREVISMLRADERERKS